VDEWNNLNVEHIIIAILHRRIVGFAAGISADNVANRVKY